MNSDYLYHLGILIGDTKDTIDIQQQFGDVKFVCLGGTKIRMELLARHIRSVLGIDEKEELVDLCEKAHRYAVFKVGPVLCCSHGIGMSTMGVLLHELIKLVSYAKCKDPVFIRIGTSGGIGVQPGTVVVTKDAYNGYLRNDHEIAILGKRVVRPAKFDEDLVGDIVKCHEPTDHFNLIVGNTMAAECFYEGQGRLDGASCEYTEEDKMEFLKKVHAVGIRNIEMEATMFSALTRHIGIKAADVCVTLLNRLNGDQIHLTTDQKNDFEKRPLLIVGRYIKRSLNQ